MLKEKVKVAVQGSHWSIFTLTGRCLGSISVRRGGRKKLIEAVAGYEVINKDSFVDGFFNI